MRALACAALIALAVSLLPGCAAAPPLVVGCDLANKPFAFLDEQGPPRGRDVEMMEALGERLQRRIVWERLPFADLLIALQLGEIDVVCATLGITPERAESVAFSAPYFRTEIVVVVAAREGAPTDLSQLAGRRIAASLGTTSELAVRTAAPQALLVDVSKDGSDHAARLLSGAVDAVALDGPDAARLVEGSGGALRRLHPGLADEDYAIALPRDDAGLRYALDRHLAALRREGALRRLDERWGLRERLP